MINKLKQIKTSVMKTSLQLKITMSIVIVFVVVLPSVALSLLYFTSVMNRFTVITDHDVRVGRLATDLSIAILDIRREERIYRLFGGEKEHEQILFQITHADSLIAETEKLVEGEQAAIVRELSDDLEIYRNSFLMLVEHISENSPELSERHRSRLTRQIDDFQTAYHKLLNRLESATVAERDSIIASAEQYLDLITLDTMSMSREGEQPSYIRQNLEMTCQRFLQNSKKLAGMSWSAMLEHRESTRRFDARAKRNIVTVLIITFFACVFLTFYLPRIIVTPLRSLMRTFARAGEGDLTAVASIQSRDEIGDLAKSYNKMIERLHVIDNLKTEKIASQKRILDRFLENLKLPACVMTKEYIAVFYNEPFAELFSGQLPKKAPESGLDIRQAPSMTQFLEMLRQQVSESGNNVTLSFTGKDDVVVNMKGRVVRDAHMNLESIVLVGSDDTV